MRNTFGDWQKIGVQVSPRPIGLLFGIIKVERLKRAMAASFSMIVVLK